MIRITINRQTATLSSLLNTLARYLVSLRDRNACWEANRDFAYSTLRGYENEKDWHKDDEELLRGRIIYNEAMCVVEVLLEGLTKALEDNPFPSQRRRLLPTATELFPDAEISFEWRIVLRGEKLWKRIFTESGISCEVDKIRFPEVEVADIREVEGKLLKLVGEEGYLKASEVALVLNTGENSKIYKVTKKELVGRGWTWKGKKVEGVVSKVVYPPPKR